LRIAVIVVRAITLRDAASMLRQSQHSAAPQDERRRNRLLPSSYIPYIHHPMNNPVHTKAFKSGNSVAVRLPKGFAIPAGAELEMDKIGDTVTIRVTRDTVEAQRRMRETFAAMQAIGAPPDGVQKRDPFDFPERPGLL